MLSIKASYEPDEFAVLIERESDSVELKTGVSEHRLQEPLVAFSNGNGGLVLVGVDDNRRVVGKRLDQGTDDKIHRAALNAHNLGRYEIRQIHVGGVPVVAVRVLRREEGFAQTSDGRILVRRGGRNVALLGSDAADFIDARRLRRFERADSGIPLADADPRHLAELCAVFGWHRQADDLPDRLRERGLAVGGNLTIAGALFLTEPRQSLSLNKATIEIRRYADDGVDYNKRESVGGTLADQVRDATKAVVDELGSDLIVTGLYRYEIPRLPEVVVRETIANAVAHRMYEVNRTSIVIEIRPRAVIVRSPGGLPEPVTVATIRQAQAARNPDIIDVLRRFSLAEDAGRGVDIIEDRMQEALLDPPVFADDGSFVTVTLPLSGPITPREHAWVNELERRGAIASGDKILLVVAARGEELTNASARAALRTDDPAVARRALKRLTSAGLLEQHGERGGAAYYLAESVAPPLAHRLSPGRLAETLLAAAHEAPLSNERARQITGLDRAQATSLLQSLVRRGLLVRTGERRGTRYTLPASDLTTAR